MGSCLCRPRSTRARDPATHAKLVLGVLRSGLGSSSADVALWASRLLCRFAAELTQQSTQLGGGGGGAPSNLWAWFSSHQSAIDQSLIGD